MAPKLLHSTTLFVLDCCTNLLSVSLKGRVRGRIPAAEERAATADACANDRLATGESISFATTQLNSAVVKSYVGLQLRQKIEVGANS